MTTVYMERCSIFLVITAVQIKTTVAIILSLEELQPKQDKGDMLTRRKNQDHTHTGSSELKVQLHVPENPQVVIYSNEMESICHINTFTPIFMEVLFIIVKVLN